MVLMLSLPLPAVILPFHWLYSFHWKINCCTVERLSPPGLCFWLGNCSGWDGICYGCGFRGSIVSWFSLPYCFFLNPLLFLDVHKALYQVQGLHFSWLELLQCGGQTPEEEGPVLWPCKLLSSCHWTVSCLGIKSLRGLKLVISLPPRSV